MSRGYWDYKDQQLKREIFGWYDNNHVNDVFEDISISNLIYDAFNLMYDFDGYISGDTGEDKYIESKKQFKDKWLNNYPETLEQLCVERIEKFKSDLLKQINSQGETNEHN